MDTTTQGTGGPVSLVAVDGVRTAANVVSTAARLLGTDDAGGTR